MSTNDQVGTIIKRTLDFMLSATSEPSNTPAETATLAAPEGWVICELLPTEVGSFLVPRVDNLTLPRRFRSWRSTRPFRTMIPDLDGEVNPSLERVIHSSTL